MKLLNLGCGARTSARPDVINVDWSPYLWLNRNPVLQALARCVLKGDRLRRFEAVGQNIMVHDLRRRLPFPDESVDAVYHSHVLEHIDRDGAESFLLEVKRVLRPGGVQRIVVPDFERLCRDYLAHVSTVEADPTQAGTHELCIGAIIEQCVRRAAFGTHGLPPLRKRLENLILGDARRRGETHQWMYDRISLIALLTRVGFRGPQICRFDTSSIPDWNDYGLDRGADGGEHFKGSLYVEARK